jgi:phospholipase A1/A2
MPGKKRKIMCMMETIGCLNTRAGQLKCKNVPSFLLKMGLLLVCLLFMGTSSPLLAQEPGIYIVPPQGDVFAGRLVRFNLFIHNPENRPVITHKYGRFMVTLKKADEVRAVEAAPVDSGSDMSITLPAQGYAKREYQFLLPESMDGNVTLSLDMETAAVLFAAKVLPVEEQTEQISLDKGAELFQPFARNFSAYEPMYFLLGVDPGLEKSKYQISFKYKLFNSPSDSQLTNGFLDGFHLAYTQTSFWDLKSDSKPFDDTSYKPEIFYYMPKINLNISWIKAFGIQTGFKHESNGKGDTDSRSTNYAYIEPIFGFHLVNNYYLKIAPRIWAYVGNDDDSNADLDKYRGYFNLQAKIGDPQGIMLDTNTRWAVKGPSFQLDLTYPLANFFQNRLKLYLQLQYFNGYAENLIDYQKKEEIIRMGFSFVR